MSVEVAPKTARAIRFTETGGPEVLHLDQVTVPAPAAHEVRLQVKAIGLNRADTMYRMGMYLETPIFPAGLGYEAAGIVEAVGAEVSGFAVGDVASVIPSFYLNQYHTYGELIVLPAYALHKHPATLSFTEASALWTSYLSVYGMLVNVAKLQAEQTVLITAASSNTGLAAIQVVNALGGLTIAVTSTRAKAAALQQAGAAHVIVTAEQHIATEVQRITDGKGANVVLDPVGGPLFAQVIAAAAERAQVFAYGILSQEPAPFPLMDVLSKMLVIIGYNGLDVVFNPAVLSAAIQFITEGLAAGKLKPIVAKSFPLDQMVEAHRYLEANQQFGKVTVTV